MKIIRSNKAGRRIHSPSIYHLVANVLFSDARFSVFDEIDKLKLTIPEKENLKLIVRLLDFYQPGKVVFSGQIAGNGFETVQKSFPAFYFLKFIPGKTGIQKLNLPENVPFVIFDEYLLQTTNVIFPKIKSVWFITNENKNSELTDFFQTLLNEQKVQVTVQIKNCGIIIFDEKIPKQNYVIK